MKEPLFDVVAVNMDSRAVIVMERGKTRRNAEAIVNMAVMRRGVERDFFSTTPAGTYEDFDTWDGDKLS